VGNTPPGRGSRLLSRVPWRFVKFGMVGASGIPVNLLFTWVGYHLLFNTFSREARHGAAYVVGIAVSIFTNFLLNDIWTWRDRTRGDAGVASGFWSRLLKFYMVCGVGALLQWGAAMALSLWVGIHYLLAQVGGIVLATAVNFVANNLWTFKERKQ